jgi:hypothetical protein
MNTLKLPTAEEMGLTEDEYSNLLIDWWRVKNCFSQADWEMGLSFQSLYDAKTPGPQ